MGLCLGAACKLRFWSERLRQKRAPSRAPKSALKLFVSVPHSSKLTSRSTQVIVIPLTVNNAVQENVGW